MAEAAAIPPDSLEITPADAVLSDEWIAALAALLIADDLVEGSDP